MVQEQERHDQGELTDDRVEMIRQLSEDIGRNYWKIGDLIDEWRLSDYQVKKLAEQVGLAFTTLNGYARMARNYSSPGMRELRSQYSYSILGKVMGLDHPDRVTLLRSRPEWTVESIGQAVAAFAGKNGQRVERVKRRLRPVRGGCAIGHVDVKAELNGGIVEIDIYGVDVETVQVSGHAVTNHLRLTVNAVPPEVT